MKTDIPRWISLNVGLLWNDVEINLRESSLKLYWKKVIPCLGVAFGEDTNLDKASGSGIKINK